MANRESRREEYSSSNVVRTLHPSRPLSPVRKTTEYNNNNLDELLDDLHTTVTRTAEHLDSAKSRDVQYLSPQNTTTIVKERPISPITNGRKIYKSSHYEYSSSKTNRDGKVYSSPKSYESVEPTNVYQLDNLLEDLKQERDISFDKENIDLNESNSNIMKTSRTTTTTKTGHTKPVNRELKFDSPTIYSSTTTHESRTNQRSPNFQDRVESQITRDVNFDTEPIINTPNSTINRSYNYSKTSSSTRNVVPYNSNIVEVDTTDLPAELKDVPISNDLLPGPGTKVTTTIKTFTYEIPNDTKVPTNQNFSYKNEFYNSSKSTKDIYGPKSIAPPPVNTTTSLYERNTSNTSNIHHSPGGIPMSLPPPSQPGTKQTYLYKKETTNTTNTVYEPPTGREYHPHDQYTVPERHPDQYSQSPPVKETYYKYSSSTTTKNTRNLPDEREPLIAPFPTEHIPSTQVDGTPKNLGQLMASFDETTKVVDDEPYVPRKEVNTALATNKSPPVTESKTPTKNIAGPPVYYPPGQELFAKSEAQAAMKAKGGYAKGSGKYEYEAESKSKNASKSGAAVVPVCLPLCCAMPCTIM